MLVTDLLVLFTVMANSAYETAIGFPGESDCLSAGQGANSTNTCSKNIIESDNPLGLFTYQGVWLACKWNLQSIYFSIDLPNPE